MGPLIAILLWLILAFVALLVWVPSVLWLLSARRRKSTVETILACLLAVGIPGIALILVATVVLFTASGFVPEIAFKREFGFSPPDDVLDLRGSRFGPFDEVTTNLDFRASSHTIDRIARHLYPCDSQQSCGDPPVVWEPGNPLNCHFRSELGHTVLIWDPTSQVACYDSWKLQ